ncbi:methyltransferase-like protein 2 isoform X2 [Actinidia eriantha]|uniref:methyltransferase-like protein 2 isoform X2 n=1 Tax=Actinidia eriantha TaxID=165200 RepID=UPI00258A5839|nr:methyltransferase-like protein 2 isoform X2 [Actinidia eriantha]
MAESKTSDRLSTFLKSGVYRFEGSHAVFVDPVRVLNRSYTRFRVSPSAYYSRFFESKNTTKGPTISTCSRKRKRKQKKAYTLNERERVADQRHQEVRPLLLKAHEALLAATDLLKFVRNLRSDGCSPEECGDLLLPSLEQSFVELGSVWQAPLYEITLNFPQYSEPTEDGAESNCGFNFILVDPPWENSSAHQKLKYPTLPNRYFLSLPIRQLTHTGGALLALWVTNREKLRAFVEKELFPSWGVKYMASLYWLKVNADGLLTSELDLFHHRPYECLLVGYCHGGAVDSECLSRFKPIPDSQVFISVPGDYSRKPPIGELLLEYVPGDKPARCIELFAREMIAGWTSWGNEPLHFQESRYFLKTTDA